MKNPTIIRQFKTPDDRRFTMTREGDTIHVRRFDDGGNYGTFKHDTVTAAKRSMASPSLIIK